MHSADGHLMNRHSWAHYCSCIFNASCLMNNVKRFFATWRPLSPAQAEASRNNGPFTRHSQHATTVQAGKMAYRHQWFFVVMLRAHNEEPRGVRGSLSLIFRLNTQRMQSLFALFVFRAASVLHKYLESSEDVASVVFGAWPRRSSLASRRDKRQ